MSVKVVESQQELEDAYLVRKIVFVDEQQVPVEEEIDQFEDDAAHFIMYHEGKPIGAGRFRVLDGIGKVERICVLKEARKHGAGKAIMDSIETYAADQGIHKLKLNAQTHAIPFYEKIGFEVVSDEFLDAGIPHKTMVKKM
ncbi:GNAT family N-acetyltransferase [Neobacillus mesonae]|uniref:GNAT family N-acetyltransferase n=1 Tax=Neobacillus mesonae TaxID=1193713 RepID=UPI0020401BB0|nr:GNAT family N-acetyltransferase [Neobacillus mesonae]MCM3571203.1 GNAT family N-acetyltransferase [Neobacillus mesonae]